MKGFLLHNVTAGNANCLLLKILISVFAWNKSIQNFGSDKRQILILDKVDSFVSALLAKRLDGRYAYWQTYSQNWPKEGLLRVRKCCRYTPDNHFARILVKMTNKFGPMGEAFWPVYDMSNISVFFSDPMSEIVAAECRTDSTEFRFGAFGSILSKFQKLQ